MMKSVEKITLRPEANGSDGENPPSGTAPVRSTFGASYAPRPVNGVSALSAWKAGPSARPSVRKLPPPPPRLAPPPTASTPSDLLPPPLPLAATSVPPLSDQVEEIVPDAVIPDEAEDDVSAAAETPASATPDVAAVPSPFDVQVIDSLPDDDLASITVAPDVLAISRSRFIAMRAIVGVVLTLCGAILVLAAWRTFEHRPSDATAKLSAPPPAPAPPPPPLANVPPTAAPAPETPPAPQVAAPTPRPAQTSAPRRRAPTRHKATRPATHTR
jgi:hypothetical protein